MLRADRDQPLPGHADGEIEGRYGPEEGPEPTAEVREAGALFEMQHAHAGELGNRPGFAQQPRPARPGRADQQHVHAGPAHSEARGRLDAGELRFPAVELAEPDAIGREPLALALEREAGGGRWAPRDPARPPAPRAPPPRHG